MAHLLPKLFPQAVQLQENGFSLVCVLSCLCTCSTRLSGKIYVSSGKEDSDLTKIGGAISPEPLVTIPTGKRLGLWLFDVSVAIQVVWWAGPLWRLNGKHLESSSLVRIGGMKLVTGHAAERGGIPSRAVATAVTGTRYGIQEQTGATWSLGIRASKQMQMWGISFVLADYPSSQKQVSRLVRILVVLREDHKLVRCVPPDS